MKKQHKLLIILNTAVVCIGAGIGIGYPIGHTKNSEDSGRDLTFINIEPLVEECYKIANEEDPRTDYTQPQGNTITGLNTVAPDQTKITEDILTHMTNLCFCAYYILDIVRTFMDPDFPTFDISLLELNENDMSFNLDLTFTLGSETTRLEYKFWFFKTESHFIVSGVYGEGDNGVGGLHPTGGTHTLNSAAQYNTSDGSYNLNDRLFGGTIDQSTDVISVSSSFGPQSKFPPYVV